MSKHVETVTCPSHWELQSLTYLTCQLLADHPRQRQHCHYREDAWQWTPWGVKSGNSKMLILDTKTSQEKNNGGLNLPRIATHVPRNQPESGMVVMCRIPIHWYELTRYSYAEIRHFSTFTWSMIWWIASCQKHDAKSMLGPPTQSMPGAHT